MNSHIDIAKLVGAASAPVALVIASCIYLGNLTQKYNTLFQQIRTLAGEVRASPERGDRRESVQRQLSLYERRIQGAMRCTFWLNVAIVLFVLTVLLTAVSTLVPDNAVLMILTGSVMGCGLLTVIAAVVMELASNRLAAETLDEELAAGTPDYQPVMAHKS
jgi:Protein of unknown function (DUF2721)